MTAVLTSMEDVPAVDVRRLRRERSLTPGTERRLGWRIREGDTTTMTAVAIRPGMAGFDVVGLFGSLETLGATVEYAEPVQLTFGEMTYVVCPSCEARVAILVLTPNEVRCRQCARLPYRQARLGRYERLAYKRDRALARLNPHDRTGTWRKPVGMRWSRWDQLVSDYRRRNADVVRFLAAPPDDPAAVRELSARDPK
jgi:hypothetical protein